jgi:glucokinase
VESFVGIEIGGTKLQLVVGSAEKIQQRVRFTVVKERGAAGIRDHIKQALPELIRGQKIAAVGVGFGGPVNWRTGKICRSHQIEGWSEFDLADWLRQLTGVRVFVDNDANVAALGEAIHGTGVGMNPVFYVTLGSGVGGGLVVDGKIYHGATPGEAEIGHVRLDRDGTTVESRCSGWAVDVRIRELEKTNPTSALAQMIGAEKGGKAKLGVPASRRQQRMIGPQKGGEANHLAAAIKTGDAIALRLLSEIAEDLAFGLSHVIHLFHPAIVIIGGGLSGIGHPLRDAIANTLPKFLMDAFAPGPQVALAALGEDAVPVGAIELANCGLRTK